MKITEIGNDAEVEYDTTIKITDFENFFDVNKIDGVYKYNLNETLYFDISEDQLLTYELKTYAHLPLIAYKLYGTTRLTWLLMKINKVGLADSLRTYLPGEKIKYLSKDNVKSILYALD